MDVAELPLRTVLNSLGERFEGAALARYLADADAAIVGLEKITGELLDSCPKLQLVAKYGVGLDNVDLQACEERGVTVGWTPGVNRYAVAEQTVGCLIGLSRNLFFATRKLRDGMWDKVGGRQISELTVGIVGLGQVGRELVRLLKPFGCRILATDIADISGFCASAGVTEVGLEDLLRDSDAVSLHVPLTPETRHLIDADALARMRRTAYLINTSRGDVVDQAALKHALRAGTIAGAAIDVYAVEPPNDLDFLRLPNLVCTPHIAGNSAEAVVAMGRSAISHVKEFYGLHGNPLRPDPLAVKVAA